MSNRYKDGKDYEKFINRFLHGRLVSNNENFFDIECKFSIFEIKGTKLQEKGKSSLGRYKIFTGNHNKLKQIADEKNKKAKYGFVLKINSRMIYKIMTWESVNLAVLRGKKHKNKQNDKECVNIILKEIW